MLEVCCSCTVSDTVVNASSLEVRLRFIWSSENDAVVIESNPSTEMGGWEGEDGGVVSGEVAQLSGDNSLTSLGSQTRASRTSC